jgi:hypothetical protein
VSFAVEDSLSEGFIQRSGVFQYDLFTMLTKVLLSIHSMWGTRQDAHMVFETRAWIRFQTHNHIEESYEYKHKSDRYILQVILISIKTFFEKMLP